MNFSSILPHFLCAASTAASNRQGDKAMQKSWIAFCLVAATVLFVAGCHSKTVDKQEFRSSLNDYYASQQTCLWSTPVKFPVQADTDDDAKTRHFDALTDAGLLRRIPAEKKRFLIGSKNVNNYDLSDQGRSDWTADAAAPIPRLLPSTASHPTPGAPRSTVLTTAWAQLCLPGPTTPRSRLPFLRLQRSVRAGPPQPCSARTATAGRCKMSPRPRTQHRLNSAAFRRMRCAAPQATRRISQSHINELVTALQRCRPSASQPSCASATLGSAPIALWYSTSG